MKHKKLKLLLASGILTVALTGCSFQDVKDWVQENVIDKVSELINPSQKEDEKPSGEDEGGKEEKPVSYTIKFVNYDNSVLQSSSVEKGKMPAYTGDLPTKPGDAQYSYTFKGWDKEIVAASADATYKATFESSVNEYVIKFVDENGNELQSGKVAYGQMPEYKGETPAKAGDAQYTYTFAGWDPELKAVDGEATYTATFSSTVREYTIKFVDEDGNELQSGKVAYGEMPAYNGETPTKESTAQYSYTFAGWDPELKAVDGEATYTATFSSSVRKYVIKFVDADGNELQSSEVEYGQMPAYNGDTPTKDGDAQYTYTFAGWDKEIVAVTGEATYTATFSSTVNEYRVDFDTNGGNQQSWYETIAYGSKVSKPEDPSRDADNDYFYFFDGWYVGSEEFDFDQPITGAVTLVAKWDAVSTTEHSHRCSYTHYKQVAPTASSDGLREFWLCSLHNSYVLSKPSEGTIEEASSPYSGDLAQDDERIFGYKYDENHLSLAEYAYGAGMYFTQKEDFKNWRITYLEDGFNCNLYSEGDDFALWRIDLPRIDFTVYKTVTMKVSAPNWNEKNTMGPEADQLTYQTVYAGNKGLGKITLSLYGGGVHMEFIDMEYGSKIAFERDFTDTDIINGLKSAYFYTTDKYDRYLNINNIKLSKDQTPSRVVYSYAGDTSKISAVNGDVKLPGSADYSIINNNYATNDNALAVSGNANPGSAVVTLPAINFNQFTGFGNISFKFGVANNGEEMLFGSGSNRLSLGKNSSTSQSENNNGYVNWEMIINADAAYVHNVKEDKNIIVPLTAGMRNGTESIILSGGGASIYRNYLFTDFTWKAVADYELIAPASPEAIYSYKGDTSKISVQNGTVSLPGSLDYSIINNNYGNNDNSLVINGNANPGAAVVTFEAINFKPYASVGKVTMKFGVKNNGESMYFGSGENKVDLGKNSPSSQSENNSGYVNWELVITAKSAYVHNIYENKDIEVTLTDAMRNGLEGISICGGTTSIYRVYFVSSFFWQA